MKEKRKNNSKKFMAVIAIVIMMGLIIGMGAITYSKYVTSTDAGSQTATAAKWGYVITADANNLFGKNYKKETGELATVVTADGVAVKASSSNNVLAPGTTGFMTISISGSAEVKAKLKFDGVVTNEISLGEYKPVKWSLTGTDTTVSDGTLAEVIAELNAETKTLDASSTALDKTYTISWKWNFESDNVKDTAIGYKANSTSYENLKSDITSVVNESEYDSIVTNIEFSLSVSIEQVLQ